MSSLIVGSSFTSSTRSGARGEAGSAPRFGSLGRPVLSEAGKRENDDPGKNQPPGKRHLPGKDHPPDKARTHHRPGSVTGLPLTNTCLMVLFSSNKSPSVTITFAILPLSSDPSRSEAP